MKIFLLTDGNALQVEVGGRVVDPVAYRQHIAYVMQDDALLATATPRYFINNYLPIWHTFKQFGRIVFQGSDYIQRIHASPTSGFEGADHGHGGQAAGRFGHSRVCGCAHWRGANNDPLFYLQFSTILLYLYVYTNVINNYVQYFQRCRL